MEDVDLGGFVGSCTIQIGVLESCVQNAGREFFVEVRH